jgi:hypothetical protein
VYTILAQSSTSYTVPAYPPHSHCCQPPRQNFSAKQRPKNM